MFNYIIIIFTLSASHSSSSPSPSSYSSSYSIHCTYVLTSQYPFWATKVALCTTRLDGPAIAAFIHKLAMKIQEGGVWEMYRGCVPFLIGAYIYNIQVIELSMRKFFATVM